MDEMLATGLDENDLFYVHLGDIADTKAQYYITLDSLLQKAKARYVDRNYRKIDDYHKAVFEKISPLLNEEEREWLRKATRKI